MPPLPYLTPAVLLTNNSPLVKVALLSPHPTPHTPEQQVMSRFFFSEHGVRIKSVSKRRGSRPSE